MSNNAGYNNAAAKNAIDTLVSKYLPVDESKIGSLDDDRISKGQVSNDERVELEKKVIKMFLQNAIQQKKDIHFVTDKARYDDLKEKGVVYEGEEIYLLMNSEYTKLLDIRPIAYRMLDTPEGLFYSKIMQQDECLRL